MDPDEFGVCSKLCILQLTDLKKWKIKWKRRCFKTERPFLFFAFGQCRQEFWDYFLAINGHLVRLESLWSFCTYILIARPCNNNKQLGTKFKRPNLYWWGLGVILTVYLVNRSVFIGWIQIKRIYSRIKEI